MEEKKPKKSKTGLIGTIMLIAGLLIGVGGSYYYFKIMNSDKTNVKTEEKETSKKNTNENKKEIQNLDVLSELVQTNFNKFMRADDYYCGTQNQYFKNKKISSKDIDNKLVYLTIAKDFRGKKEGISSKEFEEKVKIYFGKDYKFENKDYTTEACTNFKYDSENNNYKYVETACGGTCGPNTTTYRISKAELTDDKLILNVKVLFPGNDTDRDSKGYLKYYSDTNLTKPVSELIYDSGEKDINGHIDAPLINIDSNFMKAGNYKFVMQKYDDNNYSFVSSEPID